MDDATILVLQYCTAFLLSVLTSYIDISMFFQQKSKFRVSPLLFPPSILFFILNGGLALLFMYVLIASQKPETTSWMTPFLSGLGTASLLRSKLFTFGEKNIEVGFEYIYNFIKNQTVSRLARHSGLKKIALSVDLARKHKSVADPISRYDQVAQEMAKTADWDDQKKTKFLEEYNAVKNDARYTQVEDKLAALIRVFIDYSDLKFTNSLLQSFLAG